MSEKSPHQKTLNRTNVLRSLNSRAEGLKFRKLYDRAEYEIALEPGVRLVVAPKKIEEIAREFGVVPPSTEMRLLRK